MCGFLVVSCWLIFVVDCSALVPDVLDGYVENTEESNLEMSFKGTGELLAEITLRSIF